MSLANSLVRASDGTPRYFIAVIQDISENKRAAEALKESEEQFRKLAHYDILTALPNRALFYDRLAHALAQARRNRWWLAVLFIDVDRFKHVNDTFGHAAGDLLLKQVSERLGECVRSDDTVGPPERRRVRDRALAARRPRRRGNRRQENRRSS